jgi:hypothetical protein
MTKKMLKIVHVGRVFDSMRVFRVEFGFCEYIE